MDTMKDISLSNEMLCFTAKLSKEDFYNLMKEVYNIKTVIFNDPATIIIGNDGKKTVVKVMEDDYWDAEKGFAICLLKHIMGPMVLKSFFKEYVEPQIEKENKEIDNGIIAILKNL